MLVLPGDFIREERKRKNISQEELCEGVCNISTLSRLERGNKKTDLKVVKALLQKLNITVPYINMYISREEFERIKIEEEFFSTDSSS